MAWDSDRAELRELIERKGFNMKRLSLRIDKGASYLFEYITKGKPQVLPEDAKIRLIALLGETIPAITPLSRSRVSYLDQLLFPLRHEAADCGFDLQIPIRRLIADTPVFCPSCGGIVDLEKARWAIEEMARVAAKLDELPEAPE